MRPVHLASARRSVIYLTYRRQRMPKLDVLSKKRGSEYRTFVGIRQRTDMKHSCIGCGMCAMVCPNEAITPVPNTVENRTLFLQQPEG